jgi:hypothetical protein
MLQDVFGLIKSHHLGNPEPLLKDPFAPQFRRFFDASAGAVQKLPPQI